MDKEGLIKLEQRVDGWLAGTSRLLRTGNRLVVLDSAQLEQLNVEADLALLGALVRLCAHHQATIHISRWNSLLAFARDKKNVSDGGGWMVF